MAQQKLLRVKDLCELLHVHRSTIYQWQKDGKLPESIKRWGSPRYDFDQVKEALARKKKSETV
jgi:excisionase family DNA binding protein